MDGFTFRNDFAGRFNDIIKYENATAHPGDLSFYEDVVVVASGSDIAAVRLGDSDECLLFAFQLAIAEAAVAAIIGAADLHPHEIVRIVDHAHLIGFGVANTKSALADMRHQ